jgi:CRP-like cAMP-binding protein
MAARRTHKDPKQSARTGLSAGNRLLAALAPDDFNALQLSEVRLPQHRMVVQPGDEVKYGYFPLDGVLSLLMLLEDGTPVEVANVGSEGFVDATSLLSVNASPYRVEAQTEVLALRIPVEELRQAFRERAGVRDLLMRFTGVVLTCTGRSVACKVSHTVEQRLAKWLLMSRDRIAGDELPFTHESLSDMLGVRRPRVSEAAEALKGQGFIDYHRGKIVITDRAGLEGAACVDYDAFRQEYERLLGPVPVPSHLMRPEPGTGGASVG